MARLKARIWFTESIIEKRPKGKKLVVRRPDKYLWVDYEGDSEQAWAEIMKKVKVATKDKNLYGVLIFGEEE